MIHCQNKIPKGEQAKAKGGECSPCPPERNPDGNFNNDFVCYQVWIWLTVGHSPMQQPSKYDVSLHSRPTNTDNDSDNSSTEESLASALLASDKDISRTDNPLLSTQQVHRSYHIEGFSCG